MNRRNVTVAIILVLCVTSPLAMVAQDTGINQSPTGTRNVVTQKPAAVNPQSANAGKGTVILFYGSSTAGPPLSNKVDRTEWPINVHAKAMVYIYGSTEGSQREVLGGMGFNPEKTTLSLWPDWEAKQMCLSTSPPSCVLFSPEYGVHFRPVTPAPELVAGRTIRLMDGYGPSQGNSLWIRIVILPPECLGENVKQVTREWLTGRWRSNVNKVTFDMFADATYKDVGKEDKAHTGTWTLLNGNIVWTYDHLSPNFRDVTPILDAGDDFFMVQEMDGSKTIFTRVKD